MLNKLLIFLNIIRAFALDKEALVCITGSTLSSKIELTRIGEIFFIYIAKLHNLMVLTPILNIEGKLIDA
jgi:hypothetical protein